MKRTLMEKLLPRFLEYVSIDTQSDPYSKTTPSTKKQWDLAKKLVLELHQIGMQEVAIDEHGYIMATLPSNVDQNVPTIGFISHMDTTPDFSGRNVKPQIIENYDGKDIVLNKNKDLVLSPNYFEDLELYIGQTLITTDGTTLLGADDKAGIAEIITAMEYLVNHPEIKHGEVRIAFTPDEEIGRGAHKFDVEKFRAEWAYTMDGSQVGELEYENFNAAGAKIEIEGKSVHPGYAKGKMVNATGIANEILSLLPPREVPEHTSDLEGFFHVYRVKGEIESAEIELIIRDHDASHFEARKQLLKDITEKLNKKYGNCVHLTITDQYRNMREKVEPVFHIVEIAQEAMESLGIEPIIKPIRGGTDGSQLSFMGLPCPNIFAGGHNFHGKYEYVPLESMEKAVKVIVKICELTAVQIRKGRKKGKN
ncbi:peptidase T [Flagellimonas flava]|uniref:Peptidase T n=1 Tax=Flagellimonas flava TaxID=570519 RepID=A0A1M5HNZ6_9FLAO|nr:peptidase T [Allomuricauda flava]SHG17684.1 tripeptide aminopeptidase [Allomuricauda flava]